MINKSGSDSSFERSNATIPALYEKTARFFLDKKIKVLFRIGITLLFFWIVNRSISRHEIALLMGKIRLDIALSALGLGILGFYFQVIRWRYVLRLQNFPSDTHLALKTLLWGNLLGFLTPGRIGEVFRGIGLDSKRKIDSVIAVIIDRLFAIAVVLVSGIILCLAQFLSTGIAPPGIVLIFWGLIPLSGGAVFIVLKHKKLSKSTVVQKLRMIIKSVGYLSNIPTILVSVLSHCCLIAQTVLLLAMFGSVAGWLNNCFIAAQGYMAMLFLPFFIANVGLREYSFGLYLKQFTTHQHAEMIAFGVSSLVLLINIILPALIGLIWMLAEKSRSVSVIDEIGNPAGAPGAVPGKVDCTTNNRSEDRNMQL